ncbi:PepSY domain-containing protein [Carboxylicivirga sp. A043]|uniref:PepSY domain-containing protein n=1 Tax=Carboxylicivirga litoralis TaxID=2816963 RepID=UPI0021CAFC29|nr:PepSY domain-containing protein [Carboxylicivirga sp. A043]MCU4155801.1 PepSY domain-containing protein [Carboxylicivirga sp. A043]
MKFWRKYHKWAGIVLSFFLLLFSASGILLNHREAISALSIPRSLLSSSYQYHNWNNAALKGSLKIDSTSTLYYGNIGCWLYNGNNASWTDFNKGFSNGIDKRKITKALQSANGRLFAGTLFGLYEYKNNHWNFIDLNIDHQRITDLTEVDNELMILTRSELGRLHLGNDSLEISTLPAPEGHQRTTSLFKTIWVLHSGEILGTTGKLLVDIVALVFIFLSVTGIIWFISPSLIKQAKRKLQSAEKTKQLLRFSVKWHNKLGYYTTIMLVFTTFTGMFLRPPLLISIANAQVKSIPYSMLDTPNAWHDQLRGIRYNSDYGVYIISTTKGMYAMTADFKEMVKIPNQPPVSVMGITVFEEKAANNYLVGSFSGLYLWNPFTNFCYNYITKQPHIPQVGMTRPIGVNMASGYHMDEAGEVYFDYNQGAVTLNSNIRFEQMPESIISNSPLSLWNLALEVHTGRIFQDFISAFYILIVPLTGLSTIILLLSGLWIYLKKSQT